jgi:S-adenosylmethionine:diacylglycerol 3-amino-3-carboxypropyl transferase
MLRTSHCNLYCTVELYEKIRDEADRLQMSQSRFLESLAKTYFHERGR